MLENAGLNIGTDTPDPPGQPGHRDRAPCLPDRPTWPSPISRASPRAVDQGAKVVFDFSNYVGPFCNTGIMVLPSTIEKDPEMVQALVTSFEEASRMTYADPDFAKKVARKEFPGPAGRGRRRGDRRAAGIQDPGRDGRRPGGPVEEPDGHAGLSRQRARARCRSTRSSTTASPRRRPRRSRADLGGGAAEPDRRNPPLRRGTPVPPLVAEGLAKIFDDGDTEVPVIADLSFTLERRRDRQHRRAVRLRQDHASQRASAA